MQIDLDFFKKLLSVPSVSSNTVEVNNAIDLVHEYLKAKGLYCVEEMREDRKILFAATEETKTPDILFNAHVDVVPSDEFAPETKGSRIYGRGTIDCKGPAVIIATLLEALKGKANVGAVFTADEEIGGNTTKYMVEHGYGAKKAVIIIDAASYEIAYGQKGTATFRLTAEGRGGHSSEPWELDNPIDKLVDGYQRIRAAWKSEICKEGDSKGVDKWFDTMAATILEAGKVGNQVPDTASMLINCRYITDGGAAFIEQKFRELSGLKVELLGACEPVYCDASAPEIMKLQKLLQKHCPGEAIPLTRLNGATDARHFKQLGVPIALINPLGGNMHCANEWVDVPSMEAYVDALLEYCLER